MNIIHIISLIQHTPVVSEVCGSKKPKDVLPKFNYIFNDIYPAQIRGIFIQSRGINNYYNLVLKFVRYFSIYFKQKASNLSPQLWDVRIFMDVIN